MTNIRKNLIKWRQIIPSIMLLKSGNIRKMMRRDEKE